MIHGTGGSPLGPLQGGRNIRKDPRSQQREREPRTNRRIRAREVMVIAEDGTRLGVMPTEVALRRAEDNGLDLVEVAPEARPPVCKILDFGKQKYLNKKKQSEAKKHSTHQEMKEVKIRPKTDDHDFEFKLKHVQRFLSGGDKVRVTLMFRGREVIHKDIALNRLERIAKEVEGLGVVEVAPKMEQRLMFMILAPDKRALARAQAQAKEKARLAAKAEKEKAKAEAEAEAEAGGEQKPVDQNGEKTESAAPEQERGDAPVREAKEEEGAL